MDFSGSAAEALECTSTAELRRHVEGLINIEAALIVLHKDYKTNLVGKKGTYSKMFLHLSNDEEERVKLVAFGATADRFNSVFEANSLVHFTGLQTQKVFSEEYRFGELDYEFKADGKSVPTLLESNYRIRRGMPFSQVKDVDTSKVFSRYKLKAKLTTDFTPYGDGLSGQAILEDSTGRLNVHVQILRVSRENKTRFRLHTVVVLKGTFRKFSALKRMDLATLTRMVVETDDDIEFPDIFGQTRATEKPQATLKPQDCNIVVDLTKVESRRSSDVSSGYHSSPSVSTSSFAERDRAMTGQWTGTIVADFSYSCSVECVWGMIMSEKGEAFEIFLHDVPDGADTLLIEGEPLSVRGSINAKNEVKVERWSDVDVKGSEMFASVQGNYEEPTAAIELRKLSSAEVRTIRARLLNVHFTTTSASLTSLVEDASKVVVKITVNECGAAFRAMDFSSSPLYFLATGSILCTGAFCEMIVPSSDAINFDGSRADLRKVKIEPDEESVKVVSRSSAGFSSKMAPVSENSVSAAPETAKNLRKPRGGKTDKSAPVANSTSAAKGAANNGRKNAAKKQPSARGVAGGATAGNTKSSVLESKKTVGNATTKEDQKLTATTYASSADLVSSARKRSRMSTLPPKRLRTRREPDEEFVITKDVPFNENQEAVVPSDANLELSFDESANPPSGKSQGSSAAAGQKNGKNSFGSAAKTQLLFDNDSDYDLEG